MSARYCIWFGLLVMLSACSFMPHKPMPDINDNQSQLMATATGNFQDTTAISQADANLFSEETPPLNWWQGLGDPLLTQLVAEGLAQNQDLAQAQLRVDQARAHAKLVGARDKVLVDWDASAVRRQSQEAKDLGQPRLQNAYETELSVNYELDFFGANRHQIQAARWQILSKKEQADAVRLTLVAEICSYYLKVLGFAKQEDLLLNNLKSQADTLDLVRAKYRIGLSRALDVVRAEAAYSSTKAQIPSLAANKSAALYGLSLLLALPPKALELRLQEAKPLPIEPDVVPLGLSSELVARRADLRATQRALGAVFLEVEAAKANRLPRFYLTGSPSLKANSLGDLLSSKAFNWNLGALIQWPIFQGGALKAQVESLTLEHQIQWLAYEKAVLNAFREVQTALVHYVNGLKTRTAQVAATKASRQAAAMARGLFEQGLVDYLIVLETERDLIRAQNLLGQAETQVLLDLVILYEALGGGW